VTHENASSIHALREACLDSLVEPENDEGGGTKFHFDRFSIQCHLFQHFLHRGRQLFQRIGFGQETEIALLFFRQVF